MTEREKSVLRSLPGRPKMDPSQRMLQRQFRCTDQMWADILEASGGYRSVFIREAVEAAIDKQKERARLTQERQEELARFAAES